MDKKKIFLWALYDFGNSIVVVVFFLYFTEWLVIDNKVPDFWYNMIYVASSVMLITTSPVLGAISDKMGRKMPFLNAITVLQFITILAAACLAALFKNTPTVVFWAAILYTVSLYFYQLQFSFYNPLLQQVATPEREGLISGIGQASNWLGQIAGLAITLPLASGRIYLFGQHGRAQTFIPAVLLFFLLCLPLMLFFKERGQRRSIEVNIKKEYKNFFSEFLNLVKIKNIGYFLLGYFLFSDAIITAQNNFPIYLQQVFNVSDKTKTLLLVGILMTSVVGALLSGWAGDKFGLKKTLFVILLGWAVTLPTLGLAKNFTLFTVFVVVMGLLFGSVWTVTRAVMATLAPQDKLGHAFSFYTLSERFSTFLGPLTWGLITSVVFHTGAVRYRVAVISMTVYVLFGIFVTKKITFGQNKREVASQQN